MSSIGNMEILQVADAVSREKGIDRDMVIEALEQAVQVAGRRKYGQDMLIRAHIDCKNGAMQLFRAREVVEEVENYNQQISLEEARATNPSIELGAMVEDELPPIDLGRIAAQTAKQVIIQKVRDAEREKQYEEFKDRVGEIISGAVKRVEYGNIIVDMGRAEAIIPRDQTIPREQVKQGDRVRAYLYDVNRERSGPQIFLSRAHPQFLAGLFAQEVPEIYDGIIEIKAVARDPGSRAKICVISRDMSIDPVGSCVGVRGSRVQAVIQELQGEKIDIIEWTPDPATLVVNCLSPAEVTKVVIDEDKQRIEVVVPDEQLSIAIGRRGQNVRLASEIIGWEIDILTDAAESARRVEEFNRLSSLFITALNVEDMIGELLVAEGFRNLEEVAFCPLEELASVEGFDEDIAAELQNRAQTYLEEQKQQLTKRYKELKLSKEVAALPHMTLEIQVVLGENKIVSLDDVADLARDEFYELVPNSGLEHDQVDEMIMAARAHWFADEQGDSNGEAAA